MVYRKTQGNSGKLILWILGTILIPTASYASSASFYLSPETGEYSIGEEFPISIMINTDGEPIVAAEGNVKFNKKELEVVSLSKEGSILSTWVPEPEFSNEEGVIHFGGTLPAGENYNGTNGQVLTVTFKALSDIASSVRFSTGAAILAADSGATNILTQMKSGIYTLNAEEVVPTLESSTPVEVTATSGIITSTTHPDQNLWYATTTASFSWTLGSDVGSLRLSFDQNETGVPTKFYEEPILEKSVKDVEEGIWYLHLQTKDSTGWGEVTHFRIQVDVSDPEHFTIENVERGDLTDPNPAFIFDSFDAISGIKGYEITLDGVVGETVPATVSDSASSTASSTKTTFQLEHIAPGDHTLSVRAMDHAGNSLSQEVTFYVESLPIPEITEYKEEMTTGGVLAIKGTTLANSVVRIFISKDGKDLTTQQVSSDSLGSFSYIMGEMTEPGTYQFSMQTENTYGATSERSEQIAITVTKPGIMVFGGIVIGYLAVIAPLAALAGILFFSLWFIWRRFRMYKKGVNKEVDEAEGMLHYEFAELKRKMEREISSLEKARTYRALTREEESVLKHLKESFSGAEERVDKEFSDIKRVAATQEMEERVEKYRIKNSYEKTRTQTSTPAVIPQQKMQIRIEKLH